MTTPEPGPTASEPLPTATVEEPTARVAEPTAPAEESPVPGAAAAERLRSGTRAWHDALEATGFGVAMLAGALPLDRYLGQLAAYRRILGALEDELARSTSPPVTRVWSADLVKLPLVEQDLRYFAQTAIDVQPWVPEEEAGRFAEEIRRTAATAPHELLGFLYVLEGSTLGALFLRRHVAAAYRLTGTDGLAYYGSGNRARWACLTTRLNETLTTTETQDQVIAAAHRAYRHTASVTEALSADLDR